MIIEIACIITNGELDQVYEGPNIIIQQDAKTMESMNDWCVDHHGKSGLTAQVLASSVSLAQAESAVLAFIKEHCEHKQGILAGNSVYVDRQFLRREMPLIDDYLHYRIVDVSTIKELAKRWYPQTRAPAKQLSHRALDDIKESIAELRFYRNAIFQPRLSTPQ